MTITKPRLVKGSPRNHALVDGRALCGGGNGGRDKNWQTDFGPVSCRRCQAIIKRLEKLQQEVMSI
jgi:hypothetical protein